VKLRSIHYENLSRLEDASIEVREHLILVGPNDAGKSSLIRYLDLLLGASTSQLYARLTPEDFRDANRAVIIEAVLCEFTDIEKGLFPDEITINPIDGDSNLTIKLIAEIDNSQNIAIQRFAPYGGSQRNLSYLQVLGLGWRMIGANAVARDLRDDRNSSLDDILKSIDLGDEKTEFDNVATRFQSILSDSLVLTGLRNKLAKHLNQAIPGEIAQDDLRFVPGSSASNDVLSDVRLQVTREGTPRNLTEQSDGTRALFAMALYEVVSQSANIVAIDEPELHLHPASQRSLGRLLSDGINQKIIATHSPHIVGTFSPESVATVKPGGIVIQPQPDFLSNVERASIRWWMADRLEPLTATHIVAVEGLSDRIVLERAAFLTERQLDRRGISIVETGGKADRPIIRKLFGPTGFQIDVSWLIDKDADLEVAPLLGVEIRALPNTGVWISNIDLEEEYVTAIGFKDLWTAISNSPRFSNSERANRPSSGPNGTFTPQDVMAFCRRGSTYKIRSAMIVADLMTQDQARRIISIESLLSRLFDQ
jgi:putative ATP-dependent endonuclease of OLD family